jgi:hypothetical protein
VIRTRDFSDIDREELLEVAPRSLGELDVKYFVEREGQRLHSVYFLREERRGDKALRKFYEYLLKNVEGEYNCAIGICVELFGDRITYLSRLERNPWAKFKGIGRRFVQGLPELLLPRGREFLLLTPSSDDLTAYYQTLGFRPYNKWSKKEEAELAEEYKKTLLETDGFDSNKKGMMLKRL